MSSPKTDRENDIWVWGAETNGKFTIRSAYNLLSDLENEPDVDVWASIWKWRGPHRVKHFLWLASHGRLLTNNERHRRHLAQDASCAFCNHPDESLSHVLRDCLNCLVNWDPGPANWMVVNTDGAMNLQSGKAAAGGLIRDELRHCFKAFSINLGACSITRAEMRGAIAGLRFAWDLGF
ncbi:Putative ribonuclease H protein At1g65750 [Linum perenne]